MRSAGESYSSVSRPDASTWISWIAWMWTHSSLPLDGISHAEGLHPNFHSDQGMTFRGALKEGATATEAPEGPSVQASERSPLYWHLRARIPVCGIFLIRCGRSRPHKTEHAPHGAGGCLLTTSYLSLWNNQQTLLAPHPSVNRSLLVSVNSSLLPDPASTSTVEETY